MVRSKTLAFQVPWRQSFGRHALGESGRTCQQALARRPAVSISQTQIGPADRKKLLCGAFAD